MTVDEQEFKTFIANLETLTNSSIYDEESLVDEGTHYILTIRTKESIKKYKQQIDNQPKKSKWKQLSLTIS